MIDSIFRHYDIRGKVGKELLLENVYDLGCAIAYYFKQHKPNCKTVSLAMDGRVHSENIRENIAQALLDSGLDVLFIGVCPTPVLYFSLYTEPVDAGIMITASHNTKEYNGFKICLDKASVWGTHIQDIKQFYKQKKRIASPTKGCYQQKDVITHYIAWMKDHFKHLIGMQKRVVIDCANGAAGSVLPRLVAEMQWGAVQLLYPEIDGTYPNHEADPIVEKNMQVLQAMVRSTGSDLGIGLDGDCDRMAPITHKGELILGDKLLAVFAKDIVKEHQNPTIVYDTKCSSGLTEMLEKLHVNHVMSPSGHAVIKDQMKKQNALVAGELSCHFFFKDRYFGYDDGIYAMLRLFEIIQKSGTSLDALLHDFPTKYTTAELRLECQESSMPTIVAMVCATYSKTPDVRLMTLDGVRVVMHDGWAMVRPSNTQPVICLRFEANSQESLARIKHEFAMLLRPYIAYELLEELG